MPLPPGAMDVGECQPLAILNCQDQAAVVEVALPGSGTSLVYRSDRVPGRRIAPAADVRGQGLGGFTLDVHHSFDPSTNVLLQGDGVRRLVPAATAADELVVASTDARHVFAFDEDGRHRRTVDAVTGATLWAFEHDESGHLSALRDQAGREMQFSHDSAGHLSAITLPGGTTLRAETDGDGYLTSLHRPDGTQQAFTYTTGGLLASQTATDIGRASYQYDEDGLLTAFIERGNATSFERGSVEGGYSIDVRTPAGRTLHYERARQADGVHVTLVDAAGGRSEEVFASETARHYRAADGTTIEVTLAADPRFGMQAPVLERVITTTPAGRQTTVEQKRDAEADDLLGGGRFSETVTRDGHATQTVYDPDARTLTATDPTGVDTVLRFDDRGRVHGVDHAGTTAASTYDDAGHLTSLTTGTGSDEQTSRVEYDAAAGTQTIVDPTGGRTVRELDARGSVISEQRPDGTVAEYDRDSTGRVNAVWAPGREAHVLTALGNGLPLGSYPAGAGGAVDGSVRSYNPDGLVTSIAQGRTAGVTVERDAAGRVSAVHLSSGVITYSYNGADAAPATVEGPGEVRLAEERDGGQLTAERWSGPVSGLVELERDGAGLLSGLAVNGEILAIDRDAAGRATTVGDLQIAYDEESGIISSYALGSATAAVGLDGHGRLASTTVAVDAGDSPVAGLAWTRDGAGRTTTLSQTASDGTRTSAYTYDVNGRLQSETRDTVQAMTSYDDNDNVVGVTGPGAATGVVDERDRLTAFGSEQLTYASDGTLQSRTGGDAPTTYTYDEHLVLSRVETPSKVIEYLTDGLGRRVGKRVDGRLVQGFLWSGPRLVAELDGDGQVVSRFIYGDGPQPLAMLRGGRAYLLVTDGVGTVRMAVDAETGALAQQIEIDAWGNVLADSAPGFQPFGFDGGIRDADTGLVRLGVRDYDPRLRRFTAPDPIGYDGGQANLYAFAENNPVDLADPSGLRSIPTWGGSIDFGAFAGGGASLGVNVQYFGQGAGWFTPSVYVYSTRDGPFGDQLGAGAGVSATFNGGAIINPSEHPSNDFSGDTQSLNGSYGPVAGGMYRSPPNPDPNAPSYSGRSLGGSLGTPSLVGGTTTSYCFLNCGGNFFGNFNGHMFGDPHFLSHDGLVYDYQGAGEFVGLMSNTDDLTVQLRLEPFAHGIEGVSRATAAAMSVAGDRVGVYRVDDEGRGALRLVVNGREVTTARQTIALEHGGTIVTRRSRINVAWPDGTSFSFGRGVSGVLDVGYDLPDARKGDTFGLLGAYTGDPTRSLVTRAGETLAVNPLDMTVTDPARLRADFGDGWRITQAESLFDDLPGQDVERYTIVGYPEQAATVDTLDPTARADAERICRSAGLPGPFLDACILDVALTGSAGMVLGAQAAASAAAAAADAQVKDRFHIAIGDTITRDRPAPGAGHVEDGEIQQYRFTADPGQIVFVEQTGACEVVLAISDGAYDVAVGAACNDMGPVTLAAGGQYLIRVARNDATTGDYEFHLVAVPATTTRTIAIGDTVTGELETKGAIDAYAFTAEAGQVVTIEHQVGDCGATIDIADDSGMLTIGVACNDVGPFTLAKGGEYLIHVARKSAETGDYSFVLAA